MMYDLIVINCAGHGPNTSGKRSPDGSLREFQFNKPTAKYLEDGLNKYLRVLVVNVHDTIGSVDVSLPVRTKIANDMKRKYPKAKVIYVSIHANAFGVDGWNTASGIETFVHPDKSKESYQLAKLIQDNLIKVTGRKDRGVKEGNFAVLRQTDKSVRSGNLLDAAVLVECEFMTNKEACELLKSDAYRQKCANAMLDAVVFMYGLKKKPVKKMNVEDDDFMKIANITPSRERMRQRLIKAGLLANDYVIKDHELGLLSILDKLQDRIKVLESK